jgi:hypothetical protein
MQKQKSIIETNRQNVFDDEINKGTCSDVQMIEEKLLDPNKLPKDCVNYRSLSRTSSEYNSCMAWEFKKATRHFFPIDYLWQFQIGVN